MHLRYHLQQLKRISCDEVCQQHDRRCTAENHGLNNKNVIEIFKSLGVRCKYGYSTDNWRNSRDPAYIKASSGWNYASRCVGWKNIPNEIKCAFKPNAIATQRLCPCVFSK